MVRKMSGDAPTLLAASTSFTLENKKMQQWIVYNIQWAKIQEKVYRGSSPYANFVSWAVR